MSFVKSESIEGKLTHWISKQHVSKGIKGEYRTLPGGLDSKPLGIWLSWDNGWEDWCNGEWPDWMKGKACLKAEMKPGLKLWHIDNLEDFKEVWDKFLKQMEIDGKSPLHTEFANSMLTIYQAKADGYDFWEWLKKEKVDGVALTDKGQWRTRMDTWLYGWDAACIVIFKPNNVRLK